MEILSNKDNSIYFQYIKQNIILSSVALYSIIGIFIKLIFSIDILLPCLWKKTFDTACIGCGLTTAFGELIQFNFMNAYHENPLIYIIVPFGLYLIYTDFKKFKNKQTQNTTHE